MSPVLQSRSVPSACLSSIRVLRIELLIYYLSIAVDNMNAAIEPAPDQHFCLRAWELSRSARNELEELVVVANYIVIANLALLLKAEHILKIDSSVYRTMQIFVISRCPGVASVQLINKPTTQKQVGFLDGGDLTKAQLLH